MCSSVTHADIELPQINPQYAIHIRGDEAVKRQHGAYELWHLKGNVAIKQGTARCDAQEAIVWIEQPNSDEEVPGKVIAYLEGNVVIQYGELKRIASDAGITGHRQSWLGRFQAIADARVHAPTVPATNDLPEIYHRAREARGGEGLLRLPPPRARTQINSLAGNGIQFPSSTHTAGQQYAQQAQFQQPQGVTNTLLPPASVSQSPLPPPAGIGVASDPLAAVNGPTARRIIVRPRSRVPGQAKAFQNPDAKETVAIFSGGFNVIVEGIDNVSGMTGDKIDIEADRIVAWTAGFDSLPLGGEKLQSEETPLEFYVEGNIVFREGDRRIYAERMYYNVKFRYGIILQAEMITPIPDYEGLLRLKADVINQVNEHNFVVHGAAATSSQIGFPRYWLQSESLTLQHQRRPAIDPVTGMALVDPATGRIRVDHRMPASSSNNFVYFGGLPVFYWPTLKTDLTKPTYYVDKIKIKNDSIFGVQIMPDLDLYQLLGIDAPPDGTKWTLSPDLLTKRGFALGTRFDYNRPGMMGLSSPYRGVVDLWGLHDDGLDSLGADRLNLLPEEQWRGRAFWQHRQELPQGFQLSAEVGWISDRNFLEQYFESEWDEWKDQSTGVELKQFRDNMSWSVAGDVRTNDFFTQTEWLPRFDHFLIGQSLFGDRFTWHTHSNVGYAKLRTASTPTNAADAAKFDPLAWEADVEGLRAATRHELDLPMQVGAVKVTPYLLGEAAHWEEDLTGGELTRLYGQAGIRASLPFWTSNPNTYSELWNLNGLAHKGALEFDYFYADANQNLDRLPLYDSLDDDSTEHFRRRFLFDTFGGMAGDNVPLKFDERFYALRYGLQDNVTSPSTEIADDLSVAKLALRQRWQTKRGAPGAERIVDWITFDMEASLFTKEERDNFDQSLGMINYDFRWHIGDRFTVLSDGYLDTFGDGLRMFSFGAVLRRPERGRLYVGMRSIEGPISSTIVNATLSYRLSEKWMGIGSTSFDFGPTGNIGQSLKLVRIGESFLVGAGINIDEGRDNVGLSFVIEPRFLRGSKNNTREGLWIPPVGYYGIE